MFNFILTIEDSLKIIGYSWLPMLVISVGADIATKKQYDTCTDTYDTYTTELS